MGFTCYWMLEVSVGATKAAGKVWIYRGGTLASDPDNRRQIIPVAQVHTSSLRKTYRSQSDQIFHSKSSVSNSIIHSAKSSD